MSEVKKMEFAIQKTLSADEVRLIRKKLKLKQKEMAELMNVSVKTIEWQNTGERSGGIASLHSQGKNVASG